MDRLKEKLQSPTFQLRTAILLIFLSLVLAVLIYKKDMQKWFITVEPLELSNSFTLVFFNRHSGCECILEYYEMANNEIITWNGKNSFDLHLIHIDLDDELQYGVKYRISFAPALLLLDSNGKERWRQEGISSMDYVFDLGSLEALLSTIE